MRPYIILIGALIVVITLNLIQINYLERSGEILKKELEKIYSEIEQDNFISAKQKLDNLDNIWEKESCYWDIFTEHDDVEEIGKNLASLRAYIKENEKVESMNELAILEQRIKHILENEKLSFASIF